MTFVTQQTITVRDDIPLKLIAQISEVLVSSAIELVN
jgi:hypothetical protein